MGETVKRGKTGNLEHWLLAGVIARSDELCECDAAISGSLYHAMAVIKR